MRAMTTPPAQRYYEVKRVRVINLAVGDVYRLPGGHQWRVIERDTVLDPIGDAYDLIEIQVPDTREHDDMQLRNQWRTNSRGSSVTR